MAGRRFGGRLFETRFFGLIIGLFVFGVMAYFTFGIALVTLVEQKVLDLNFFLKNTLEPKRIQEGVSLVQQNPRISPDILIVGIDDRALARFGKWPFPRYVHADLIDAFSHIQNQNERERALFLDVFFPDEDRTAQYDAQMVDSIKQSARVMLETVLDQSPYPAGTEQQAAEKSDVLFQTFGTIRNIQGDWREITTFHSAQFPLEPYARAAKGYGNASFDQDPDEVVRRQPLVAKLPALEKEIRLDALTVEEPVSPADFERLSWEDRDGVEHNVPYPLTAEVLN